MLLALTGQAHASACRQLEPFSADVVAVSEPALLQTIAIVAQRTVVLSGIPDLTFTRRFRFTPEGGSPRIVEVSGTAYLKPLLMFDPSQPRELASRPLVLLVGNKEHTWSYRDAISRNTIYSQSAELAQHFSDPENTTTLGMKPLRTINLDYLERSPDWSKYVTYLREFRKDYETTEVEPLVIVSRIESASTEVLRGFVQMVTSLKDPQSAQVLMEGFYEEPRMVWFQRRTAIATLVKHGFPPELIDKIAAIYVLR
jgi:hypothetical protein